jgi:nitroreductase
MRASAQAAQFSPSACNLKPCRLTVVSNAEQRKALLEWQNASRGFGHLALHVAIVTADENFF